jgi:hypothetical protein
MTLDSRKRAVSFCAATFNVSAIGMTAAGAMIAQEPELQSLLAGFNTVGRTLLAARPWAKGAKDDLTKIDPSFPYVMTDVDKAAVAGLADHLASLIAGFEANSELRVHSATVDLAGKVTVTLW